MRIVSLSAADLLHQQAAFVALLLDAVADGASVGFLHGLTDEEATEFWQSAADAVVSGTRRLLGAYDGGGALLGTVQLDLATKPNGRHRAEVTKLLVFRAARQRGVGRALMLALEEEARSAGRTTLVLDTATAAAERLYEALGYVRAGVIPDFALNPDGSMTPTVIYYKLLAPLPGV